jgi:hypothetical protein
MIRFYALILMVILTTPIYSQIKIDDVGDGWKSKVDSALNLIKSVDSSKYKTLTEVCNHVSYWNGGFSTTEDSTTILISQKDMGLSVANIASVIVHESKHLWLLKCKVQIPSNDEEVLAYRYELEFLRKVPNVEPYLINHAINMIKLYGGIE